MGGNPDMYHELRNMMLNTDVSQISVEPGNECPVFGAVIDLVPGNGVGSATMICMLDGTVSIYYSSGGGILGIGQRHAEVREQGFTILANAVQLLEYFNVTEDFSLPTEANACFMFFLTENGVYKAAFHMNRDDEGKVYNFLNHFVQNLLHSIIEKTKK